MPKSIRLRSAILTEASKYLLPACFAPFTLKLPEKYFESLQTYTLEKHEITEYEDR